MVLGLGTWLCRGGFHRWRKVADDVDLYGLRHRVSLCLRCDAERRITENRHL